MAKQDSAAKPEKSVCSFLWLIDIPGCLVSESAGWTLVTIERFWKIGKIQDGRWRPFWIFLNQKFDYQMWYVISD